MYTDIRLLCLLSLSLIYLLPLARCRSLSVSLNMSLTRTELPDQHNATFPKLSHEMLHSCMRETEISMSQLKLFRLSLISNDYSNDNEVAATASDMDYVSNSQLPFLDLKRNEPLQCFVRCLYERLGLVKYDVLLEDTFKKQVQNILQHEKSEIKECMDLQSKNHCEAAYKLHLCYNHMKTLDAEQRIREVLERSENENEIGVGNEEDDNNEKETGEDFIDGIQHSSESETE